MEEKVMLFDMTKRRGKYRQTRITVKEEGNGTYTVIGTYRGRRQEVRTKDAEIWKWIEFTPDLEKCIRAQEKAYALIRQSYYMNIKESTKKEVNMNYRGSS